MHDKLVVIHQPDFIPYIGFFERLLYADIYVVLDNVQYVRRNKDQWTNRDQIKTRNGRKWITVNVKKTDNQTKINKICLSEEHKWRSKCKNILRSNYCGASYYGEINQYIDKIIDFECELLIDFNIHAIQIINSILDIKIEMVLASDLYPEGKKDELNISIVKKLGCTQYLSGMGAKAYCNEKLYEENGIKIIWQDFQHPVYPQQFGEFIPYLSIVDLLYNCGIQESRRILRESVFTKRGNTAVDNISVLL